MGGIEKEVRADELKEEIKMYLNESYLMRLNSKATILSEIIKEVIEPCRGLKAEIEKDIRELLNIGYNKEIKESETLNGTRYNIIKSYEEELRNKVREVYNGVESIINEITEGLDGHEKILYKVDVGSKEIILVASEGEYRKKL